MDRKVLRSMIDQNKAVAKSVARQLRRVSGQPDDPDVRIYQNLTKEDFDLIREEQGEDGLMAYIQTLEEKRLRGSNG